MKDQERIWSICSDPVVVTTESGATYMVASNGMMTGGTVQVVDAQLIGALIHHSTLMPGKIVPGAYMLWALPNGTGHSSVVKSIQDADERFEADLETFRQEMMVSNAEQNEAGIAAAADELTDALAEMLGMKPDDEEPDTDNVDTSVADQMEFDLDEEDPPGLLGNSGPDRQ